VNKLKKILMDPINGDTNDSSLGQYTKAQKFKGPEGSVRSRSSLWWYQIAYPTIGLDVH